MKRSDFLRSLAVLPFVGKLVPQAEGHPFTEEQLQEWHDEISEGSCPTCNGMGILALYEEQLPMLGYWNGDHLPIVGPSVVEVPCYACRPKAYEEQAKHLNFPPL